MSFDLSQADIRASAERRINNRITNRSLLPIYVYYIGHKCDGSYVVRSALYVKYDAICSRPQRVVY